MQNFFSQSKIPTLLGLAIITAGIVAGVILNVREQIFISKASPNVSAKNITLSNVKEDEVTISWETDAPVASYITFGQTNPNEVTVLDDRKSSHYVTLKNLLPKTIYQYKIVTGKIVSEVDKFTTAAPLNPQAGFKPIIGSVLDGGKPLDEGIVYLSIAGAATQSAPVLNSGNFLIPLSGLRMSDLSDYFPLTETTLAKLTIVAAQGGASAIFKIRDGNAGLPPIKLGENVDLTKLAISFDLNGDSKINAADNAIILQNLGPVNAVNQKADLNRDGIIDQKDLDLMAEQINQ